MSRPATLALAATVGFAGASSCGGNAPPAVCPDMLPTWTEIGSKLIATTCTTGRGSSCHGPRNVATLNFEGDAYAALLGPDGKGAPASNVDGTDHSLRRVLPGDAASSFLIIKLRLAGPPDARWGRGMPLDRPGAVCKRAVDRVATWIDDGAPR